MSSHPTDALLSLLLPFWQGIIAVCVVLAVVVAAARLARRGRSRMRTGLLVTGGAVLGIMLVGALLAR